MKKIVIIGLVGLMGILGVNAKPVDSQTAGRLAVNFWNTYRPQDVKPVTSLQTLSFPELQYLYVFANEDAGFVVVAADDQIRPVLGYSFVDPFPTRLHSELQYWFSCYEQQIAMALAVESKADPRWNDLLDGEVPLQPKSLADVPALCNTAWDQGKPYNLLCPYDTNYNDRAVVGCVATAMAQIMKRWNHPSCGTGSHSYSHYSDDLPYSYGVLSADFEHTTYRWEDMPNHVTVFVTEAAENALSTLSYHCGVSVNMMYGTSAVGGSAAYSSDAAQALFRYFKYDSTLIQMRYRSWYGDSEWLAMIDEDLALGRPIYYAGSDPTGGHAFVLDGSNTDTMYHFNWGWSGYGNGFYYMSNLAPSATGAGGNATSTFNLYQCAILGIQPVPEHFDTVAVYDTICTNASSYEFHGYSLQVTNLDINLRHLDTIFLIHLTKIQPNVATFSANMGLTGGMEDVEYCSVNGLEMIECPFTKTGSHFIGWSTNKSGTPDTLYQPGNVVFAHGNVVYYARWKKNESQGVEAAEQVNVKIWPNPTTDKIVVSLDDGQEAQVQVFDAVGRIVEAKKVLGSAQISLMALPNGIYTVQVKTYTTVYNQRVIKQ